MDNIAVVTRVVTEYNRAFSTLDVKAIVPYFHVPSLFVTPLGVHTTLTLNDLKAAYALVIEGLRGEDTAAVN
jgi:hypothetical protein